MLRFLGVFSPVLPVPTQIGRYVIKSRIGRGGMGDLYLAHDPNTNRLVALKLLNATLDSSELRERFVREARALAALNHPNIVNIYDTGEFEGSPFIVMEYVRGETLAETIKRRAPVSVSQKLKWMMELCAGVAQAHDAGIIHRDIKPANLIVDQQGRLKILDFGIARVAEDHRTRVGLPLTQVNMLIGTPGYMSPEQIEGGEVDHRSDIFAVGAVCYELLSYNEAFSGANTRQIERRVLLGKPAPLASLVPGLDPEIDEIVLRALKSDPNKRYQDAATFENALDRLRSRLGPDVQGPPPRQTPPPPPSAGVKSREVRAEAAYQRSLSAYRGGALDAARRFGVEALAEDPSHERARALLARLEAPRTEASQPARPEPAQSTIAGTAVGGVAPTIVGPAVGKGAPTIVGTAVGKAPPTIASAPTIIVSPAARVPAPRGRGRDTVAWSGGGPFRRVYERLWKRDASPSNRRELPSKRDAPTPRRQAPLWVRYGLAAQAVGLLVIVAGIVTAVMGLRSCGPSGQMLTITRPVNGTILAAGITCGTRGADCSASRPTGDSIELRPEPDAGFAFDHYTGDCAPGGRTIMSAPRVCGATFAAIVAPPPALTQVLTIAPVPTGGTLEGVDIICGTNGSVCSANYPDGVPVEMHPTADPGFTFMGFLGDCKPLGHTQMTGPRTCGATFSRTADVALPPVLPPIVARGGRGSGGVGQTPPTSEPRGRTTGGGDRGESPRPPPTEAPPVTQNTPGRARGSERPTIAAGPAAPPPTDEEYAKGKIQDLLKEWCAAYEAIDPAAVQRVYPKVDMPSLTKQLNKTQYKSVQCKVSNVEFPLLDAIAGTAKIQVERKLVYERTILTDKKDTSEMIATLTLLRPGPRSPWLIDAANFKPK